MAESEWLIEQRGFTDRLPQVHAEQARIQQSTNDSNQTPASQSLIEPLSDRELEVLRLVAEGLSNREIGERLFLALDTIKGNNRRIYAKLGVQRRTEAIARAHELGWSLPLQGVGAAGAFVANPVMADGIAYLQDAASNVTAVRYATGEVLWTHPYNAPAYGPNGVTIAYGRIYGVTPSSVFALDAQTGEQVWNVTDFGPPAATFNLPPQVAGNQVFVSSSLTVGGGIIYALDASTGATAWSFQTVIDPVGQQLQSTAGGAWNALLIGPDKSVYAGIGNPYLSQQQAQDTPSRQLYTNSLIKLGQATGELQWYFQAFPNDFHDWDLQISPLYTTAADHAVVLAAGKGGFVFAFDPANGELLWKTSVGTHNGHDDDGQLALDGKLQLQTPYTLYPGGLGGVLTNMAAVDGVVYAAVVNLPTMYDSPTSRGSTSDFTDVAGDMVWYNAGFSFAPSLSQNNTLDQHQSVYTLTPSGEYANCALNKRHR